MDERTNAPTYERTGVATTGYFLEEDCIFSQTAPGRRAIRFEEGEFPALDGKKAFGPLLRKKAAELPELAERQGVTAEPPSQTMAATTRACRCSTTPTTSAPIPSDRAR